MASIPPKSFYKLPKEEQITESIRRMNAHYEAAEKWKKVRFQSEKGILKDPYLKDPDLIDLVLEKETK